MVFSSLAFLFAYLPTVLAIYYLLPRGMRNVALFFFSLLFYGWGEPIFVLLMLASITSAFSFGFLIKRYREKNPKLASLFTGISVSVNLAALFFFKYYNFFASAVHLPVIEGLALPIGISFYTFQILSYTLDLRRGTIDVQKNYISFGTYVTMFPQLVAGPIVKYQEVDRQLTDRRETLAMFSSGVVRFCCGFAKKVLVGDALAASFSYFSGVEGYESTVLGAWLSIICYTGHIYYDFSGYSDMAIGLGKMFGFSFPENFNYPYISKSITEFWRRWHITLSSWFREYVYIPLGGNRRGKAKQCRNLFVVWALTGLWHGASWNFVIWGLYFFVILMCEHLFLKRWLEKTPSVVRHFYTMLLVTVGFLIFSYTDPQLGFACFGALFGFGTVAPATQTGLYTLGRMLPLLLIAAIGATPFPKRALQRFTERHRFLEWLTPIGSAVLFLLSVSYLADFSFSPFAYFNF